MANRSRSLLFPDQIEEFTAWAERSGWKVEKPKGVYEKLRLRHPDELRPVMFHQRSNARGITAHGRGLNLVHAWLRGGEVKPKPKPPIKQTKPVERVEDGPIPMVKCPNCLHNVPIPRRMLR